MMNSAIKKIYISILILMCVCILGGFSSYVFAIDTCDGSGDCNIIGEYQIDGKRALRMTETIMGDPPAPVLRNIYIGENAGALDPDASGRAYGNIFIGRNTGSNFEFGAVNTFIGEKVATKLKYGLHNTYIGAGVGEFAEYNPDLPEEVKEYGPSYSTIVGTIAGQYNVGAYNTFIGTESGRYITTGRSNMAIGTAALADYNISNNCNQTENDNSVGKQGCINTTGIGNIHIGVYTGTSSADLSSTIVLGINAHATNSNQMVVGSDILLYKIELTVIDCSGEENCEIGDISYDYSSLCNEGDQYTGSDGVVRETTDCTVTDAGMIKESFWGSGVTYDEPHSFSFNATGGFGDDVAGADLILAGGKSTGSADGGKLIFKTSPAESSGSDSNELEDRMVIDSIGNVNISNTLTLDAGSSMYDISPAIIIGDNSTDFSRSIQFVGNGGDDPDNECTIHYASSNRWLELGCGLNINTGNILRLASRQSWISAPTSGTLLNVATSQLNLQSPTIYFTGTDQYGNPDNDSVKVGIGTSTPTEKLSVAGTIESTSGGIMFPDGTLQTTASGQGSTSTSSAFYGYNAGAGAGVGGVNNTMIGSSAGYGNTSGTGNVFLGYQAGYNETGNSSLYIANSSTTAPLIYGDFNKRLLEINGDLYVTGNMYAESDISSKEDIRPIDSSLKKILSIQGVSYKWKNDMSADAKTDYRRHFGVIAQQVEKVLPELVKDGQNAKKKVAYMELIPVIIEAMKEQQKKDIEQSQIILEQQNIIAKLIKRLNKLEREVHLKGSMAMAGSDPH